MKNRCKIHSGVPREYKNTPVSARTHPSACVFGQTRGLSLQGVLSSAFHYGSTVNAVAVQGSLGRPARM